MGKIITVVLLVIVGVYLFRRMASKRAEELGKPPETKAAEDMVRCKVCGVNLPRSEAVLSKGRFYCCDEHRRADS